MRAENPGSVVAGAHAVLGTPPDATARAGAAPHEYNPPPSRTRPMATSATNARTCSIAASNAGPASRTIHTAPVVPPQPRTRLARSAHSVRTRSLAWSSMGNHHSQRSVCPVSTARPHGGATAHSASCRYARHAYGIRTALVAADGLVS
jgi:hypothetical protein